MNQAPWDERSVVVHPDVDSVMAACAGIGLATACGFRVFVPLLATAIAVHSGNLKPSAGFEWIGSWTAIIIFGVATGVEVLAYLIPWVDHALDVMASPAAVVAGTLIAATVFPFDAVHPAVKWSAVVIAGGGVSGTVQGGTVLARVVSGITTGGFGNPFVSVVETAFSVFFAILSLVVPILCAALAAVVLAIAFRNVFRRVRARRAATKVLNAGAE